MVEVASDEVSLSAVFGDLAPGRENELIDRLVTIDQTLKVLADEATGHVKDLFFHWPLRVYEASRSIAGGASSDVGDVWFEVWRLDPNQWEVSASIPVHCDLMPRGGSCLHDLYN